MSATPDGGDPEDSPAPRVEAGARGRGVTRTHEFLETCRVVAEAWASPFVEITAIASIAAVVYAQPDGGLAQVAVGGITSVAIGKRYLEGKISGDLT